METQPYTYFPGGPVVENPPASAGNMGLIPGLGRCRLPWSNQAHTPEGCAPQQEKQPLLTATRESPCTAMDGIAKGWTRLRLSAAQQLFKS